MVETNRFGLPSESLSDFATELDSLLALNLILFASIRTTGCVIHVGAEQRQLY